MVQPPAEPDVPTIYLSIPTAEPLRQNPNENHVKVGMCLVETLCRFGFVKIIGHGFPKRDVDEALAWTKKLFGLPLEEKMKAPHPLGPIPHRGYSSIGKEKVYPQADVGDHKNNSNGYMTTLYDRLLGVDKAILEAIAIGLSLDAGEHSDFVERVSGRHCQLCLLHYPEVTDQGEIAKRTSGKAACP
ncbi:hypothetical protein Hte_002301 [Hypoxylon texense]